MGIFRRGENWYVDYYFGSRRVREKVGSAKGETLRALAIRKLKLLSENSTYFPLQAFQHSNHSQTDTKGWFQFINGDGRRTLLHQNAGGGFWKKEN
jgi:hypothetical protein